MKLATDSAQVLVFITSCGRCMVVQIIARAKNNGVMMPSTKLTLPVPKPHEMQS